MTSGEEMPSLRTATGMTIAFDEAHQRPDRNVDAAASGKDDRRRGKCCTDQRRGEPDQRTPGRWLKRAGLRQQIDGDEDDQPARSRTPRRAILPRCAEARSCGASEHGGDHRVTGHRFAGDLGGPVAVRGKTSTRWQSRRISSISLDRMTSAMPSAASPRNTS